MHAIGVDIIEIERIEQVVSRWGEHFLHRIYTDAELSVSRKGEALAVRFAGKEAVMKVLGTGAAGVGWREIEILPDNLGKPCVQLYGRARARAADLGLGEIAISLSHSREYAVASALAESTP